MATNLEVIVGTYEQFLLGYKVEQDGDKYSLHQSFAVHAHNGSIRTVHANGKYLASGGADDRIYVYDMKKRQEIQLLTMHNAMINHLRFTPDVTHLFSASCDGSLAATRAGSWISEGLWKSPHSGKPVTHISIHPSGKLALTLGADLTLKTWNLVKGRHIFTTNLKSKSKLGFTIEYVEFCPSGENFVLTGAKSVEIWSIQKAGIIKTIACETKPTSVCWLNDDNLLIGLNDGKLYWCDLDSDEPLKFEMYESRVKGIWYQNDHLASISSNGDVTVWNVNIENQEIMELCTTNIGCRPICLTMLNLADFADEYILKREDLANEIDESTDVTSTKKKVNSAKNVGIVVIEEDDDKEETVIIKPKEKKQENKTKLNKNNTPTKSSGPKTTPLSNIKRKSMENRNISAQKKSKLQKSQNNSGFIEEDMD